MTVSPSGDNKDAPYYVINVYTFVGDRDAAVDMAIRISENLDFGDQVDKYGTTVSFEDDSPAGERVYADLVMAKGKED
jgi:hypothetical protein